MVFPLGLGLVVETELHVDRENYTVRISLVFALAMKMLMKIMFSVYSS